MHDHAAYSLIGIRAFEAAIFYPNCLYGKAGNGNKMEKINQK